MKKIRTHTKIVIVHMKKNKPVSFSPYENAARHYSMDQSVCNSNSKSSECEDSFKK